MNENLSDQVQKKLRKLYLKDMAQYLEQALAKAQKNQSGHLAFLADIVDVQMEARITSYNVCYTKLLRDIGPYP